MPKQLIKTKWLLFGLLDLADRKTQLWKILSIRGESLGFIKWFSRWRCYAFHPKPTTVFNSECLKDIKEFIDNLMTERKTRRQP